MVRLTFRAGPEAGQGRTLYVEDVTGVTRVTARAQRYAFAVFQAAVSSTGGQVALLLAAHSETEAQGWVGALRACSTLSNNPPENAPLDIGEGKTWHSQDALCS